MPQASGSVNYDLIFIHKPELVFDSVSHIQIVGNISRIGEGKRHGKESPILSVRRIFFENLHDVGSGPIHRFTSPISFPDKYSLMDVRSQVFLDAVARSHMK
uniref:Uncharacterized protein n=1 Tax=Octactis speculum TaxID=3111310 RepID=A0A7S2DXJ9_9STRA